MQQTTIALTTSLKNRLEEELDNLRTARQHVRREEINDRHDVDEGIEITTQYSAHLVQDFLRRRIMNLEALLEGATVVDDRSRIEGGNGIVEIGSVVTIRDMEVGEEWTCTLADTAVADLLDNGVSDQSPVGKALLNKGAGTVVEVTAPAGKVYYKIIAIR